MVGCRWLLRSAGLGAATMPIAIALIVRWSLGGAPAPARATLEEDLSIERMTPLPRLTESQRAIVLYADSALEQPFGASPLHGVAIEEPAPSQERSAPVSEPTPENLSPAPRFDVTSLLVSSKGALVMINGKLRRVGDEIEPQWRLERIDVEGDVVVIAGPEDRVVEVAIRQRGR